jgi:hypothetical protein
MLITRFSLFCLVPVLAFSADASRYRSVSVDRDGRLHIVLDSGKEILPRKRSGQTSFGGPTISPDRRSVAWLAMYPDPTITYYKGAELGFELVVYRAGRAHVFDTDQMFWDWQFQDGGRRVAYSTGPTHGSAAQCILRDAESGRVVAHWWVKPDTEPPAWAQTLRR